MRWFMGTRNRFSQCVFGIRPAVSGHSEDLSAESLNQPVLMFAALQGVD